jgi:GNAT superfamily N-acetyltransferase
MEQIKTQLVDKGDRYPTLVAEHSRQVVAWASAGAYRNRPAYAGVAEHSVYVARSARGKGAGRVVLEAFCGAYAERGFWKIVSRIFPENTASLALQRAVRLPRRRRVSAAWEARRGVARLRDRRASARWLITARGLAGFPLGI